MREIIALIEQADRALASAQVLLDDGDPNGSASRAYYAMFYVAEAALLGEGVTASTHAGVLAAFGERFVLTERCPRALGRDLKQAFLRRQRADYDALGRLSAEQAQETLTKAKAFIEFVKPLALGRA